MNKELSKLLKDEKKVMAFMIRSFYEIKKLLHLIKKVENEKDPNKRKELLHDILKKHRGGLFGGEERVERKLFRKEKQLEQHVHETFSNSDLKPNTKEKAKEVNKLMNKLKIYNNDLAKLCSRGGIVEQELRKAESGNEKDINNAFISIKKSLNDVQVSDVIINNLINKTKDIKSDVENSEHRIKKNLKDYLLMSNPTYRVLFDREYRKYIIKKAPRLIPVIAKAILTDGASLRNPKDIYLIVDFAINDPSSPKTLKNWANKFLKSDKGKRIASIIIKKKIKKK